MDRDDGGGAGGAGARAPAGQWASSFTEAKGREIVRRVAEGEPLYAVCEDPRMPWASTVLTWAERHAAFGAALQAARHQARAAARAATLKARFAAQARVRRRSGARSLYTPELAAEICERLAEGESLVAIARDPQMPCASAVYDWIERHPEFEAAYVRARQRQAETLADMAREVAMAATPRSVHADRLRFDAIRWQAARLAPRKYDPRVVLAETVHRLKTEAEAPGNFTVILKRYCDVTEEELRRSDEGEP